MTGNTDIPRARAAEAGTFWTREVERGALGLEQLCAAVGSCVY